MNTEQTPADRKRAIKVANPFEKGTLEYKEEIKRRLRENWTNKKNVYRNKTKEANTLPIPKKTYFKVPDDLKDILGDTIQITNDIKTWYFLHSKRTIQLSETTQKQYKNYNKRIPEGDIWSEVRFVKEQPVQSKAQFIKSRLAHVADKVANFYESNEPILKVNEYNDLILAMFVWATLSKKSKSDIKELQASQITSQDRIDRTIDWDDWTKKANMFIMRIKRKKEPTERDLTDMALAAVYSYLPPIRLDYDNVTIVKRKPKTITENTLVLSGNKTSAFYWVKFKNASAFKDLPIEVKLPRNLLLTLKRYVKPDQTRLFNISHFSEYLTALTEVITNIRFSNRLMRSSYIKNYYQNIDNGAFNINEAKKMMRQIHQTNIEISLSYIKRLAEGETDE
jgi:hypothetical protein